MRLAKVIAQAFPIDWQLIGIRQNIMSILAWYSGALWRNL